MDKNNLFSIYGMWHVPLWQTNYFYGVLAIGGIFLMTLILWYGIKKYRASKRKGESPWDVALKELVDIEQTLSGKEMLGKTFYFRLTWMFKRYLNARYGYDVYGKTDGELVSFLEITGLAPNLVQDIRRIFEGSSVIKFANEQVVQERIRNDLVASITFIKKTTFTKKTTKNS